MWTIATYRRIHRPSRSAWFGAGGHLALSLHSTSEPSELWQWPCHDDSTINIVTDIIRSHRSNLDAVCCYRPSSVVCLSVVSPAKKG